MTATRIAPGPIRQKGERHTPINEAVRDEAHRKWIASLPCTICGGGPCQCAHNRAGSNMLGKRVSDYMTLPLCVSCHEEEHLSATSERNFWADHGYDESGLYALCSDLSRVSGRASTALGVLDAHRTLAYLRRGA